MKIHVRYHVMLKLECPWLIAPNIRLRCSMFEGKPLCQLEAANPSRSKTSPCPFVEEAIALSKKASLEYLDL